MDHVEQAVRAELARAVNTTPPLPGLADRVIQGGRRRRRVRAAVATGTVLAAVAIAGVQLVPSISDRSSISPATPTGPPTVPMVVTQGSGEILDWNGGTLRTRALGDALPVGALPSGILLVTGGPQAHLDLLANDATTPRSLIQGLASTAVAVSSGGDRATVVTSNGNRRELHELELPSGRELRTVTLAEEDQPVLPAGYSDGTVLLTIGEGSTQRTALWEAGDEQVIGTLDGFTAALGGAADEGRSTTERAAFLVADDKCREVIAELKNGVPTWPLCGEHFAGFSPDGEKVLAVKADTNALIVHDADDGDTERVLRAPQGLRAYGWESDDTVLYTTVAGNATVVIRCAVKTGDCRTAATYPGTDRIPQPMDRFRD